MLHFIHKTMWLGNVGTTTNLQIVLNTPKKSSLLKSSHLNKYLQNFPTQKYPGIENFKPKITLWSSPTFKIQSTHLGLGKLKRKGRKRKEREGKGKKGRGVGGWTRKGRERERGRGGQKTGKKWSGVGGGLGKEKKGSGVGRWTRKGRERERGRGGQKRERNGVG